MRTSLSFRSLIVPEPTESSGPIIRPCHRSSEPPHGPQPPRASHAYGSKCDSPRTRNRIASLAPRSRLALGRRGDVRSLNPLRPYSLVSQQPARGTALGLDCDDLAQREKPPATAPSRGPTANGVPAQTASAPRRSGAEEVCDEVGEGDRLVSLDGVAGVGNQLVTHVGPAFTQLVDVLVPHDRRPVAAT